MKNPDLSVNSVSSNEDETSNDNHGLDIKGAAIVAFVAATANPLVTEAHVSLPPIQVADVVSQKPSLRSFLEEARTRFIEEKKQAQEKASSEVLGAKPEIYAYNFENYAKNFENYAKNFENYAKNFENSMIQPFDDNQSQTLAMSSQMLPNGTEIPETIDILLARLEKKTTKN